MVCTYVSVAIATGLVYLVIWVTFYLGQVHVLYELTYCKVIAIVIWCVVNKYDCSTMLLQCYNDATTLKLLIVITLG